MTESPRRRPTRARPTGAQTDTRPFATSEQRSAVGDAAALLGQIAAEEAADLIVVGSRARGRLRGGLESGLIRQLETTTPVPVLIAPPRTRRASKAASYPPHRR